MQWAYKAWLFIYLSASALKTIISGDILIKLNQNIKGKLLLNTEKYI